MRTFFISSFPIKTFMLRDMMIFLSRMHTVLNFPAKMDAYAIVAFQHTSTIILVFYFIKVVLLKQ